VSIAVVVGNPKPQSRTLTFATAVATACASAAGVDATPTTIDLAEYGPELFDFSSTRVASAVSVVSGSTLAVVASPTFKASYTGLLKSFLDWFGAGSLNGVTVVPVMVGAGAAHALAVEVHLRPVLVEIGALLPTRGLYVTEDQLGSLDSVLEAWLVDAGPRLRRALS
jgi:FMN reductase